MLLTLSEAAGLLERRRGDRVHRTTIKAWGDKGHYKLYFASGWKVDDAEFIEWASRCGRLKKDVSAISPERDERVKGALQEIAILKQALQTSLLHPVPTPTHIDWARVPVPKLHATGQAYVRWKGKCKYFGKYGTPKAEAKYFQWRQDLTGSKQPEAKGYLISDLIRRFGEHNPSKNHKEKLTAVADLGPIAGFYCSADNE